MTVNQVILNIHNSHVFA